jgi:phospholipase C
MLDHAAAPSPARYHVINLKQCRYKKFVKLKSFTNALVILAVYLRSAAILRRWRQLMSSINRTLGKHWQLTTTLCTSALALSAIGFATTGYGATDTDPAAKFKTASPIKHVIILIGENRGLDHTFGVYRPKGAGQTISNILSKGIVNEDGTPGPNFGTVAQMIGRTTPAVAPVDTTKWYFGLPANMKTPYSCGKPVNTATCSAITPTESTSASVPAPSLLGMPQPNTNGAPLFQAGQNGQSASTPPFPTGTTFAQVPEADIDSDMFELLTTGFINQATQFQPTLIKSPMVAKQNDLRIPGVISATTGLAGFNSRSNTFGPFPLQGNNAAAGTTGSSITDDDYTGDMTHRFFQAAQQQDCDVANITDANPTGCLNDLFAFVMDTYDRGNFDLNSNGLSKAPNEQFNFSEGNEMGFYNAEQGQVALLNTLADRFTLSDNFHQSFLGGTGANHVMLGTADAIYWTDGNGNATTPPLTQQADPNPTPGTLNNYNFDDNFVNCSDFTQPGVAPIVSYLNTLGDRTQYPATAKAAANNYPEGTSPNCDQGHWYMVDNTNPGFLPNGFPVPAAQVSIPASPVKTIGDSLSAKGISWTYYGGSYRDAVALSQDIENNPVINQIVNASAAGSSSNSFSTTALEIAAAGITTKINGQTVTVPADPAHALGVAYCQICNPFQYATSIMSQSADAKTSSGDALPVPHLADTVDLITAIQNNDLPAVSFGKPDGLLDGHPSSSKIDLFEAYVQHVLEALEANPSLKATTAVFVTWDEAGGYWDSGFVSPVDFFGDGTRIPLLILSSYSTGGKVNHAYADHVSIDKFIERNWGLKPITDRSRDNFPNPTSRIENPYVPANMPALDDLFDAFDFSHAVNQPFFD